MRGVANTILPAIFAFCFLFANGEERHLIIHAGPWKTGTTTIQAELKASEEELRKHGVFIPSVYLGNHHFVVEYFTRNNKDIPHFPKTLARSVELFTAMLYEIGNSTAKYVVISAESFSIIDLKDLAEIRTFFTNYKVTVLLYYRNPMAWSYSMYRQELRDFPLRTPITLSAYLLQAVPLDSPVSSYVATFYKFEAAFGRNSLKIVDYDGFIRNGVHIMDSFFAALNIPMDTSIFKGTHKASLEASNKGLDSTEMYTRQLWRLFDLFCKDHQRCSTYNRRNEEILKYSHLANRTTLGSYASTIPVQCLHLGMVTAYSLELDRSFRQNFGHNILYGDQNATADLIAGYRDFCQLDVEAVLTVQRERWYKIFRLQMAHLASEDLAALNLSRQQLSVSKQCYRNTYSSCWAVIFTLDYGRMLSKYTYYIQ